MRILEQRTLGKHEDERLNEDGLHVGNGFVAVVDGVTSKSRANIWEPTPGVVAKNTLLEALRTAPDDTDMRGMQQLVDEALRAQYRKITSGQDSTTAYFCDHPNDRLQANAVIYSEALHEIWLFGDCQAMVNGRSIPTTKRVDMLLGELRSFAWQALELQRSQQGEMGKREADAASANNGDATTTGSGLNPRREPNNDLSLNNNPTRETTDGSTVPDPARELIMPFLRLQSQFANRRGEYGYFVFDGFTDPKYPIHTIPVRPGDEVVLASDGYPKLRPTLDESERELERLRREDPHLVREFRTTKGFAPGSESFDDRTYIRFVA
ncbi:hypothetical protein JS532_04795 [Bifidobacterium callimiconis]|uniref:hypothetical protein n=1 Tax=Bifidobacterium callimiconis TaxID=2306973 RepID=UPI001BDDA6EF|nr:hypothetical protein [Bifidobacterium callimiconis]MBT1176888.1 hypothetical protein [Bifidobacterium callimiconis]